MRLTASLDDALASRGHVRILRALDQLSEGLTASAREVARRASVVHNRASEILADLARQGLVDVEHVARSDLYELNREHVLFPVLHSLFAAERDVPEDLERFLRRRLRALVRGVEEAYLFGSVARNESRLGSDIDLAVVVPRARSGAADVALTRLATEVRRRYGTELSGHVSTAPLAKRLKGSTGRGLWRRIKEEGVQLLPVKGATHA